MKRIRITAAILGAATAMNMAKGTEVSLSLDAASAYVFRGATFNDGAVLQPGMEVSGMKLGEFEIPITLGVWGNLDLDKNEAEGEDGSKETVAASGKFSEVDLYASLEMPTLVEGLDWSVGYTEYLYPQAGGDPDREVNIAFAVDTMLAPAFTAYYGVDGLIEKSTYLEFGVSHGFALTDALGLELGATLGYLIPDEGEEGFNSLDLSAALSWKAVTASVVYVAQLDDEVLVDVEDGGLYDVEVVGMISLAQTF